MTKTMTINQMMPIANDFLQGWQDYKGRLQLKGKPLFHLIALKKQLEKQLVQAQETVAALAEQFGGVPDPAIGGYRIPEERQKEANVAIGDLVKTEVTFDFTPIKITEADEIPADLLDILFDFVEMVD